MPAIKIHENMQTHIQNTQAQNKLHLAIVAVAFTALALIALAYRKGWISPPFSGQSDLQIISDSGNSTSGSSSKMSIQQSQPIAEDDALIFQYIADNDYDALVELIDAGNIDINARNKTGRTPLICAVEAKNLNMVKLLIENSADIDLEIDFSDIKHTEEESPIDNNNSTYDPNRAQTKSDLEKNLEKKKKEKDKGKTALSIAIENWETVDTNKPVDTNEIVDYLLQEGADPNKKDNMHTNHVSPFIKCCLRKKYDLATKLIQYKIDPDQIQPSGSTNLHMAIRHKGLSDDSIIELVKNGADLKLKTRQNETLLYLALKNKRAKVAEYLLECFFRLHIYEILCSNEGSAIKDFNPLWTQEYLQGLNIYNDDFKEITSLFESQEIVQNTETEISNMLLNEYSEKMNKGNNGVGPYPEKFEELFG